MTFLKDTRFFFLWCIFENVSCVHMMQISKLFDIYQEHHSS
jgi:hypothetical protein